MTQPIPLTHVSLDGLLEGVAIATNKLLTVQDAHESIQQAIAVLGAATQVDRIYIFENHAHPITGEPSTSQRWEWVAPGVASGMDSSALQNVTYSQFFIRWYHLLNSGKIVTGWIKDFPDGERKILEPQEIQSILVIPITIHGIFWGFIGFDDCHDQRTWTQAEKNALFTLGNSIGITILQHRKTAQLQEQERRLAEQIYDHSHSLSPKLPELPELPNPSSAAKSPSPTQIATYFQTLQQGKKAAEQRSQVLERALQELKQTQHQSISTENISELGQLAGGIARELTIPLSFVHGNLGYASTYLSELLALLTLYEDYYPNPHPNIAKEREAMDLSFIAADLPDIIESMDQGTNRIVNIVRSLRTFSRTHDKHHQVIDLHTYLNDALTMLRIRMKGQCSIQVMREYGDLPPVECYPGQLSQVFMNILSNAINTLQAKAERTNHADPAVIHILTQSLDQSVVIRITDNGLGMSQEMQSQLFHPSFTNHSLEKSQGLGLAIAHQIITQRHQGTISCASRLGQGSTFTLTLPISLAIAPPSPTSSNIPSSDRASSGQNENDASAA